MRGHSPFKCKKELETANLNSNKFLELGMLNKTCDCKDECKNNK